VTFKEISVLIVSRNTHRYTTQSSADYHWALNG